MTEKTRDVINAAFASTLSKIIESYSKSGETYQKEIISRLESLSEDVRLRRLDTPESSIFDSTIAKGTRIKAGVSLNGLARSLGLGLSGLSSLSRYESGKFSPSMPIRSETSKKYLYWLKEQGYNPFGIK